MEKSEARKIIMKRMENLLKTQGNYIMKDEMISAKDKCVQMDVVLDVMHFLQDYDECTKILNEHRLKKRYEQKFLNEKEEKEI